MQFSRSKKAGRLLSLFQIGNLVPQPSHYAGEPEASLGDVSPRPLRKNRKRLGTHYPVLFGRGLAHPAGAIRSARSRRKKRRC